MNKKLTIKSIMGLLLAMVMTSACLFGCAPASSSEGDSANALSEAAAQEMTVAVQVDPTAAEGKVDAEATDLALLSQEVTVPEGATAYDALVATGAALEGSESYVTSINGLAEKAAGPTYGWMYEVNGEVPSVAANECALQPEDSVRWYYSSWGDN